MQSDDAAEPVEWNVQELKRSVDEWEAIAAQIIERLYDTVACAGSENWRPHFGQIVAAVERFRDLCERESEQLGSWRADGLYADEAYEQVWDAADRLVKWLNRMMQQ